jgi:hypothetical protein
MVMLVVLISKFQCPREDVQIANTEEDIHVEYDQERSHNKGQVPIMKEEKEVLRNGHSSDWLPWEGGMDAH